MDRVRNVEVLQILNREVMHMPIALDHGLTNRKMQITRNLVDMKGSRHLAALVLWVRVRWLAK